jgi:hypothetical protein
MTDENQIDILKAALEEVLKIQDCPLEAALFHFQQIARGIAIERAEPKVGCVRCGAQKRAVELGPGKLCLSCLNLLHRDGKVTIEL